MEPPTVIRHGVDIPGENLNHFAVVDFNGHQYKVTVGDEIMTNTLKTDVGEKEVITKVLLIGNEQYTVIGRPFIPNASVTTTVEEKARLGKVLNFRKRRRKNSSARLKGHRTDAAVLSIEAIDFDPVEVPSEAPATETSA